MNLNEDQLTALQYLTTKKSFAVLGPAGSGKTTLSNKIRSVVPSLVVKYKSACLISNVETPLKFLMKSNAFSSAVVAPEFTIIFAQLNLTDEADVISVDRECRRIRKCPKPFGGCRVVALGDMFQVHSPGFLLGFFNLNPVKRLDMRVFKLTKSMRHKNCAKLLRLLRECRALSLSPDSQMLLNYTLNSKPFDDKAIHIFSSEKLAREYNDTRLKGLPGTQMNGLKVGAPVRLTSNKKVPSLSPSAIGMVKRINVSTVAVEFDTQMLSFQWPAPLQICFALSVRVASDCEFDNIVVHGTNIFAPGQLYTALSRAKSIRGIACRNVESEHATIQYNNETKTIMTYYRL